MESLHRTKTPAHNPPEQRQHVIFTNFNLLCIKQGRNNVLIFELWRCWLLGFVTCGQSKACVIQWFNQSRHINIIILKWLSSIIQYNTIYLIYHDHPLPNDTGQFCSEGLLKSYLILSTESILHWITLHGNSYMDIIFLKCNSSLFNVELWQTLWLLVSNHRWSLYDLTRKQRWNLHQHDIGINISFVSHLWSRVWRKPIFPSTCTLTPLPFTAGWFRLALGCSSSSRGF